MLRDSDVPTANLRSVTILLMALCSALLGLVGSMAAANLPSWLLPHQRWAWPTFWFLTLFNIALHLWEHSLRIWPQRGGASVNSNRIDPGATSLRTPRLIEEYLKRDHRIRFISSLFVGISLAVVSLVFVIWIGGKGYFDSDPVLDWMFAMAFAGCLVGVIFHLIDDYRAKPIVEEPTLFDVTENLLLVLIGGGFIGGLATMITFGLPVLIVVEGLKVFGCPQNPVIVLAIGAMTWTAFVAYCFHELFSETLENRRKLAELAPLSAFASLLSYDRAKKRYFESTGLR